MKKYIDYAVNKIYNRGTGNAAAGITVTVRDSTTGVKAVLLDDDLSTDLGNPITTDLNGKYEFNIADGVYDIIYKEGEAGEQARRNVYLFGAPEIHVNTLVEMTGGRFPVGAHVVVADMGDAYFIIEPSGTSVNTGGYTLLNGNVANISGKVGYVKPEWYGAKGDGSTDDYQAIQNAIDAQLANGLKILFTSSFYRVESQLDVTDSVNLTMIGQNAEIQANFASDERIIGGTDSDGLYIEGISFNQRYSVTGFGSHLISLLNPRNCKIVTCDFGDFAAFGVLMFTNDRGASGIARNNHIVDCTANGFDVSYGGGFAMESMADSSITGRVTRVTGNTPGYAVNLKNNCTNCMADVIVSNSNAGLVLSDDGPSTIGNGVKKSFVKANVSGCSVGASFNKCEGVHADLNISGSSGSGDVGLAIYGLNLECDYDVSLYDCDSTGYAVTSRSDNQRINVRRYDMSANKLLLWEPGTDRNRLVVGFTNISGNGPNIIDYVDDDASNLNNEVVYLRDAPTAINSGGTYSSNFVFPLRGASVRTDNMISLNQTPTMTLRVNATNMLSAEQAANAVSPGSDNSLSCGRASYRWTEVFATTGTINTSDEREKEFYTIEQAEKAAALAIKSNMRKYRMKDSVASKGVDGARIHYGVSAQEVGQIMSANGLDPHDYGFFCYDEWNSEPAEHDADGNVVKPAIQAGNRYGIRYEELLCFIMSAI